MSSHAELLQLLFRQQDLYTIALRCSLNTPPSNRAHCCWGGLPEARCARYVGDAPLLRLVLLYGNRQQELSVAVMAVWYPCADV
jgi:hypothetical protein